MGLDTTHGCWHGPYSAFGNWRADVAKAAGIDLRDMQGYGGTAAFNLDDPLTVLLSHSDCDGAIAHADCERLANRLEGLLPKLPQGDDPDAQYMRGKTQQFIKGLRMAHAAGEDVGFH